MKKIVPLLMFFLIMNFSSANAFLSEQEAKEIGINAYLYFYPLVIMDVTRKQMVYSGAASMNKFVHIREYPPVDMQTVVRPNFDTLYSIAWVDISKEPVILSVPDTSGRYYLMPIIDMWSDVFAAPGKRTTGTEAGDYALVPENWRYKLPEGVQCINVPTPVFWIIGRTQTNGPEDYNAVHIIQDGYKLTPLSQWRRKNSSPVQGVINHSVDMTTIPMDMTATPAEQVNNLSAAVYFEYAVKLMKTNPPHVTDWSMVAQLKKIGIEPSKNFNYEQLDPVIKNALDTAPEDAIALMQWKAPSLARVANGWSMNTDTMGTYGNYYLKRAIIALTGLGANQPEDAVYPINIADANGNVMVGGKKYVLHFAQEELPPVDAFWSVTMYNAQGYQTPNALNRFAVSSWMPFKYNQDGSLDLYIQHDSPGADKESNWLPSPANGNLGVTMRLYAPRPDILNGKWNPPAVIEVK